MPTLTLRQAAAHFRRAAQAVPRNTVAAQAQAIKSGLKAAITLSGGPHSTAQLRAAGHPYSRQRPNSAYAAQIINVQTGRFKNAWKGSGPAFSMGILVSHITNDNPEARFLNDGTKNMIARPIAQAIVDAVQPGYAFALQKAVSDALSL